LFLIIHGNKNKSSGLNHRTRMNKSTHHSLFAVDKSSTTPHYSLSHLFQSKQESDRRQT
jgi:hypothetical protein